MTMIQKVADAIAMKLAERGALYSDCDALARVAIEALHDPSPEMILASLGALKKHIDTVPDELKNNGRRFNGRKKVYYVGDKAKHALRFNAAIDAALKEE